MIKTTKTEASKTFSIRIEDLSKNLHGSGKAIITSKDIKALKHYLSKKKELESTTPDKKVRFSRLNRFKIGVAK